MEVSTQFWPWDDVNKIVGYGDIAAKSYPYTHIWLCDHVQYEETAIILAALAMKVNTSVGPMVTFPWRNPMELAQRYSTLSKIVHPGKQVAIGIGGGGAVEVGWVNEKVNPVSVIRESVIMLTELLAGKTVNLGSFPQLGKRFRYNPEHNTRLFFPPASHIPVYLGAGGIKVSEVAGSYADGVIFASLPLTTSLKGVEAGIVKEYMQKVDESRRNSKNPNRPFKKMYNLHVSVSKDGQKAMQWAKRNSSYGIAGSYLRYPDVYEKLGIDIKGPALVAEAYQKGLGLEEAAKRVSDELINESGQVIAGTPDQVIEGCRKATKLVQSIGFDHIVYGVPIGPNVPEALDLLGRVVIPAVMD